MLNRQHCPASRNLHAERRLRPPVTVYVRNLPHWRQSGATYFVTFRLGDSIPAKVLQQWLDERDRFYHAHGVNPAIKSSDPDQFSKTYKQIPIGIRRLFERKQARMLHEELDRSHGACVLKLPDPRKIVTDALAHFHGQRIWLGDWVVMPNHVHALINPFADVELEDVLGSIKKWASRRISAILDGQKTTTRESDTAHMRPRLWQQESYDRIVRDREELTIFRQYIAKNASEAKLQSGTYEYYAADWLDEFAVRPVA